MLMTNDSIGNGRPIDVRGYYGEYTVGPWGPEGKDTKYPTSRVTKDMWAELGWTTIQQPTSDITPNPLDGSKITIAAAESLYEAKSIAALKNWIIEQLDL